MASDPHPLPIPTPLAVATVTEPNPNNQTPSYEPPMGVPLPLAISAPASTPRRLPPPCWTPDETSVLIDSYRDKWYSLRRGNLRAAHWEDVASQIHSHCPHVLPPKTAVQCRHKMEKLRKRYRAELQRAKSIPHHRFSSSWVYFGKMDAMEKNGAVTATGTDIVTIPSPVPLAQAVEFVDDVDDEDDFGYLQHQQQQRVRIAGNSYTDFGSTTPTPDYALKSGYSSSYGTPNYNGGRSAGPSSGMGMKFVNMNSISDSKKRKVDNGVERGKTERRKEKGDEAGMEMVEAIRMLGEGFVKMEKMKMDMMRETERMRMEMEMKRTQMLLDSQHRIVEAFAKGWSDLFSDGKIDQDDS